MKTKILNKKEKKLPLNKISSLAKPKQRKDAVDSKKVAKKAKLAISVQNGNPTLEDKVQVFKIVDKKKWKQNKGAKQQNAITVSSKTKIKTKGAKEETSSTAVELEKDILSKTDSKKLEYLERRQKRRNVRKEKRRRHHSFESVAAVKLNIEEVKKKIKEIKSREILSKRAKRILAVLHRKLRFEESANKSDKLDTKLKKSNKKDKHIQTHKIEDALVKNKQTKSEDKIKTKKRRIQDKKDKIKSKRTKQDDINVMKGSDDEDETEEDQSDTEEELMDTVKEQIDDKSDEDKVDEEDTDNEASISEIKKNKVKSKKKQPASLDHQKKEDTKKKKKRYVLSVDNLPISVSGKEIEQHFLTNAGIAVDVKIRLNGSNRYACVETGNNTDFKKALLLHNTLIRTKRITVQEAMPEDNKKANVIKTSVVAKRKKLRVHQKTEKLAKNQRNQGNQGKKKPLKKKKQSGRQKHNKKMIN